MKTHNQEMKVSVLALAVQGALAAMFALPLSAHAANAVDDEAAALKRPTNSVEIGVANVSKDSAKFGEYNGLNKSGAEFVGNVSVRGGDAYDGGDGTLRWGISGTDLGTTSREFGATVGNQGRWSLSIGQDELRHNISDSYQTPMQGSMGGNSFTMPTSFGVINAAATKTGNAANPADPVLGTKTALSARVLNATQLGAFHTENVGTTRKNTSFAAGYIFSPQLSLQFDYNHLAQSGAKLISASSYGGSTTPALPAGGGSWRAEAYALLMNPTNYKTDTYNLALNWAGEKGHLTGSYYASTFRDGYDSLSWQNPIATGTASGLLNLPCAAGATSATCFQTGALSTAPGNNFNQLNLTGGYAFSPATKLAGGLSYGRNTQDDAFLTGQQGVVLAPQSSLNGLVVTTHADLKLTHQATKALVLSAGLKHNERDNRTSSSKYQFWALNGLAASATNKLDAATNAPYSNKKSEFELAGDYRLDKRQSVRLAYDHEDVTRWCNNYGIAGSDCVVSPSSKEDKLGIRYKLKASSDVGFNAGYTYAKRKSDFDHSAITPLSGLETLTPHDVNAQDYPGFIAYIYASRKQEQLKAGVNWQATEQLDLSMSGRYVTDKYFESTLGVQDSQTTGLNLDATFSYGDGSSVSAYASWQNSKKNLKMGAAPGTGASATPGAVGVNAGTSYAALVAPTNIWTNDAKDDGNAFGIAAKHRGLMGGKLEFTGDLSYSIDKTDSATLIPYYVASAAAPTCSSPASRTCGDSPTIKSELTTLKLTGIYQVDKSSKVAVRYMYQKLTSDDYNYQTTQYGYTPLRGLPANLQEPNYSVNVVTASYIYNF